MIKRYELDAYDKIVEKPTGSLADYNEAMESINELVEMLEDVIIWTNESIHHDEVIMEAQQLVNKYRNSNETT